jgi:hypothetical protein
MVPLSLPEATPLTNKEESCINQATIASIIGIQSGSYY